MQFLLKPPSELAQHHFCHILLARGSQRTSQIQAMEKETPVLMGGAMHFAKELPLESEAELKLCLQFTIP